MRRTLLLLTTALATSGASAQAQDLGFVLDPILLGTAFRDERAVLDTPAAASVIEGEDLANRQAGDFQDLIGDLPGMSINGGPRGMSQEINIRGFSDDQIVLRFDGGRFNYSQGHRGRFFVDPDLIGSVEVVRGGGSTLYGSGALGGVVSVETISVADLLGPDQTEGGRVTLGYSSNGEQVNANSMVYADWGDWDALLFVGGRQINADLEAGGGDDIAYSQVDSFNGHVAIGFEPSADSRFELTFSSYLDEGQIPSNSNGAVTGSNPLVDREAEVINLRLSWDYAPVDSDWIDLSVLAYGTWLEITEDRVTAPRLDETRYETFGFEVTNRSSFDLGVPVDLVYGFEAFRDTQEGERDGAPRTAFPDAEADTVGVFMEATASVSPSFDVIAGLRYDLYERDPSDATLDEVSEEFLSPRLGVSYRPTEEWQIFANVARAFRAPSLTELYNSGLHFAIGGPFPPDNFFVPNPNLDPEESTQFEIGARFERMGVFSAGDRLSFSANAYYAEVENFIEMAVNIFAGTTTFTNVDAELWGFEAEVDYDAERWFAGAGLSIARGEGADGDWLWSLPEDRLTLEAGYRPNDDWSVGARATFAAEPIADDTFDGYQTLDLFASFAPEDGVFAGSTIRFGIDNVFDEDYVIYPNGLSQTGRSFELTATFTF